MYADYHIHTEFSDDSREPMEKQIEKAIELGLQEICFTDHVDYGIKKDWEEGNIEWREGDGVSYADAKDPLANVDYPAYFDKIGRMKEIYGDRIRSMRSCGTGMADSWILPFFPYIRWTTRSSGPRISSGEGPRKSTTRSTMRRSSR